MTRAEAAVRPASDSDTAELIIRQYYHCFNERRFVEAGMLFADNAVLEQLPLQRQERGGIGYLQFVSAWLRAFPDAVLTAQHVSSPDGVTYEVDLAATGTHQGALDLGGWIFRPTGIQATFRVRELLQVHDDKIAFSSLSFDLHEIIDKLAKVEAQKLLEHIHRLHQLAEDLQAADTGSNLAREIIHAIGQELDSARHVVRPYYKR